MQGVLIDNGTYHDMLACLPDLRAWVSIHPYEGPGAYAGEKWIHLTLSGGKNPPTQWKAGVAGIQAKQFLAEYQRDGTITIDGETYFVKIRGMDNTRIQWFAYHNQYEG